jgi:hypothetical protein
MLSPLDDYLIHQDFGTLREVVTSDRRFFDRHFFVGYSEIDNVFFLAGMGLYPNLGVIDSFITVLVDGKQRTLRGSRELGADRSNTLGVGPFGVEIVRGLHEISFSCEETDGIGFDLTWQGAVPAFEEPRGLRMAFGRVLMRETRLIQSGYWSGSFTIDGKRYTPTWDSWWGGRDRSWGVRPTGFEEEPDGINEAHAEQRNARWIWSPMQFKDVIYHVNIAESDGVQHLSTVRQTSVASAVPRDLTDATHDLDFDPETGDLRGGTVSFRLSEESIRTIRLEPISRLFLMAGTGYGGPDSWRHGKYMGKQPWSSSVSFDVSDPDVLASLKLVRHTFCRMVADDGDVGYGSFETAAT